VAQLDQITQQNAGLVHAAAGSTEALEGQARSLAEALGAFRLDESGPEAEPGPAARAAIERASARPAETAPALRAASRRPKAPAAAADAVTT